jgi:hypothetical protein
MEWISSIILSFAETVKAESSFLGRSPKLIESALVEFVLRHISWMFWIQTLKLVKVCSSRDNFESALKQRVVSSAYWTRPRCPC